jgi:hypothetical protein
LYVIVRGDQIKKTKRRGELHEVFWWGNLRERSHLEDPRVDWRIILKCTFEKWDGSNCIDLAQDRDVWRAVVSAVMYLRVP